MPCLVQELSRKDLLWNASIFAGKQFVGFPPGSRTSADEMGDTIAVAWSFGVKPLGEMIKAAKATHLSIKCTSKHKENYHKY